MFENLIKEKLVSNTKVEINKGREIHTLIIEEISPLFMRNSVITL